MAIASRPGAVAVFLVTYLSDACTRISVSLTAFRASMALTEFSNALSKTRENWS
jgi:hypothetical protein